MLKVGLVGLGFMGRGHLDNYLRLQKEDFPLELVAVCDVEEEKLQGKFVSGNIEVGEDEYDMGKYRKYKDYEAMLAEEELDYLDVTLPTYLHAEASVKALEAGTHVLCEKPMARDVKECREMIEAAERKGKKLMIAQCLRFWPEYEILGEYVRDKKLGQPLAGYFFRGGGTPRWSYRNWVLQEDKGGGALLDQHVHDVDMINWLFGTPEKVSTSGKKVIEGSGYDTLSTNYFYRNGMVINAQDDWTLNGDYGFRMTFRVNFERGNLVFEDNELRVNPEEGESFTPESPDEQGYYREIKYFAEALMKEQTIEKADPRQTMESIRICQAEMESADRGGELVELS